MGVKALKIHYQVNMKDRIRQIMESQHMSQQVFAQFIEMSPASLSSIFNGRTKPTLNIVEAIKKKIPDISTDWLMFGRGPMYLGANPALAASPEAPSAAQEAVLDFSDVPTPSVAPSAAPPENRQQPPSLFNSVKSTHQNPIREEVKIIDTVPRRVTEIRVFYDDQTWESFLPAKK